MEIYDHPTFRMACQQFDLVADHLNIPETDRARLKYPKRSLTVALPIKRDNERMSRREWEEVERKSEAAERRARPRTITVPPCASTWCRPE